MTDRSFARQFLYMSKNLALIQELPPNSQTSNSNPSQTLVEDNANSILSGFIISSTPGLRIARALQSELCDQFDITIWNQMVFEPSQHPIEALEEMSKSVDFAIVVITPDDFRVKGGIESFTPRDNVVFELGLFIGSLGRDRVFMVCDEADAASLPTDLGGLTQVRYRMHANGNLQPSIAPAATKIRNVLDKI